MAVSGEQQKRLDKLSEDLVKAYPKTLEGAVYTLKNTWPLSLLSRKDHDAPKAP